MGPSGFAVIFGLLYVGVGILGMIPAALTPVPPDAPVLRAPGLYGYLLGVFPVNWIHSTVHLLIGAWGIAASRKLAHARAYTRAVAVIFAVLFVFGLVPGLSTLFGYAPLFGHDIWLHALTAALAAYIGFFRRLPAA